MTDVHPVQTKQYQRSGAELSTLVTLRAYEVYVHMYGEQKAMITNGCRGGFSAGEIIAFLYARSFPREEWSKRVNEALSGMKNL